MEERRAQTGEGAEGENEVCQLCATYYLGVLEDATSNACTSLFTVGDKKKKSSLSFSSSAPVPMTFPPSPLHPFYIHSLIHPFIHPSRLPYACQAPLTASLHHGESQLYESLLFSANLTTAERLELALLQIHRPPNARLCPEKSLLIVNTDCAPTYAAQAPALSPLRLSSDPTQPCVYLIGCKFKWLALPFSIREIAT